MNESKARNPHMWKKWEASGAIGCINTSAAKLEIPPPAYLIEGPNTAGPNEGKPMKWIGMELCSQDGDIKKFLWWKNVRVGNFRNEIVRNKTAESIARLKLEMNAETAIGFPIDLDKSNPITGSVEIFNEPGVVGVYVEAGKRPMFNFFTLMQRVRTVGELMRENPVEFNEALQKAKESLPLFKKF